MFKHFVKNPHGIYSAIVGCYATEKRLLWRFYELSIIQSNTFLFDKVVQY